MMTIDIPDGDAFSLDQLRIFIAAADHGSFSAAARAMGKAQSLVSHSIQRMEDQLGVTLFDRASYRPSLTLAGGALLTRARRICNELNVFHAMSRDFAAGSEAEVRLAVDAMYPMCELYRVLRSFRMEWPAVAPRVMMHNAGEAAEKVVDRQAILGLLAGTTVTHPELDIVAIASVPIVTVVSAHHPLAPIARDVTSDDLMDHVHIAVFDTDASSDVDTSLYPSNLWQINDLGAAYGMLLAGLGWGGMPRHLVEADVVSGRLVELTSSHWKSDRTRQMSVAKRKDVLLRPAADWLWRQVSGCRVHHSPPPGD